MIFGTASGVERAALGDEPGSTSELRDFGRGQVMRVTHCASNGSVAPCDHNMLTFLRRLLLHGTGPGKAASTGS